MVNAGWAPRSQLRSAVAATLIGVGCVPIPSTVALSPRTVGTLLHEDRTPVVGERLLLAVEPADSACANPVMQTTTDSLGRFQFPALKQREGFTVVLFERSFSYSLCLSRAGLDPVYHAGFLHRVPAVDSLSCVAEGRQVRCASKIRRRGQ